LTTVTLGHPCIHLCNIFTDLNHTKTIYLFGQTGDGFYGVILVDVETEIFWFTSWGSCHIFLTL